MNETAKLEHSKKLIQCLGEIISFLGVSVIILMGTLLVSIQGCDLTNTVWLSIFIVVITIPVIGLWALVLKHRKTLGGDKNERSENKGM